MDKKSLVETADGTYTARSERFDECYHSTKDGAFKESLKKHVEPAFSLIPDKTSYTILDICFGLGYNTLTTLWYLDRNAYEGKVQIFSPELDEALVRSLVDFPYPEVFKPYVSVIASIAKTGRYVDQKRDIRVIFGDAREFLRHTTQRFDIVYQDAFSPKKNPLLWTTEYFADLASHLEPYGIVTTYSSATPVRLGMAENGLKIYEPPSKGVRKGTIATFRKDLPLSPIDMVLKKKRNPSAAPFFDADFI